jgi:BNR repeat-like domain
MMCEVPVRVSRRQFLAASSALAAKADPSVRREIFRSSPGANAVFAYAFYTRPRGGEMIAIEEHWTRSDTVDTAYFRRSEDYGRTWASPTSMRTGERLPKGMLRRHPRCGFVASDGRYLEFWIQGILPSDDPLEGLRNWNIYYRVSRDGGRRFGPAEQIIHAGAEFSARHPLPGVWTGKNCVMLGDVACVPIAAPDGGILLPVEITPLDPNSNLYNPGGGYTYTDVAVLHGRWRGHQLHWEMSDLIKGDPARSSRGMDEATIEFLADGRLLMVLRGSNDRRPELPGYRWFCLSSDVGRHWTTPQPWTYADGQPLFSPSSCSQLLRHSSGRLFWLGNITPANPRGNRPRYPFVIGEVDRGSGLLRDSVRIIDTLQPGEDANLSLSNFYAREDRRTREIVVHMTRLFAGSPAWSGNAYVYYVAV